MLRTANLHLFHIGIHRFVTIGHPRALVACYEAHWRLFQPDFHWQAVTSLQDTRLAPIRACPMRANKKTRLQILICCLILFTLSTFYQLRKIFCSNSHQRVYSMQIDLPLLKYLSITYMPNTSKNYSKVFLKNMSYLN